MHLGEGLESRAVAVNACDDEVIPSRIENVGDDADLEEVYNSERHLLYVACTRARNHLLVTGVAPPRNSLTTWANPGIRAVAAKTKSSQSADPDELKRSNCSAIRRCRRSAKSQNKPEAARSRKASTLLGSRFYAQRHRPRPVSQRALSNKIVGTPTTTCRWLRLVQVDRARASPPTLRRCAARLLRAATAALGRGAGLWRRRHLGSG
jgi:UvrD-like helicase C-terminal domain